MSTSVERLPEEQRRQRPNYGYDDISASGLGTLLHRLSPRFPVGYMRMVDEIVHISDVDGDFGKGYVEGTLLIDPDQWFFGCHFIDDPVMPGCLGLDALWQLTGFYMSWQGYLGAARALGVKDLSFRSQITPKSKQLTSKVHVKRIRERPFVSIAACGELWIDGQKAYVANDMAVGIFPQGEVMESE